MPAEMVDTSSALTVSNSGSGDASVSFSTHQAAGTSTAMTPPLPVATKKKRNLPGMPDPDAEVISLSPRALMATNRFVCEICNKGFQRDQNLQLHRRGHNLPWKLRQRTTNEVKKRVYICPEPSCIHHSPSRALGDLTGIKKHFSRKHGEKKWKCDKCSKWYAVQSDWKAHYKTCGTREYRRDGFITHRAFCDALAEEKVKVVVQTSAAEANSGTSDDFPTVMVPSSSPSQQRTLFPAATSPVVHQQNWQQLKELENTIDADQIRTQIPLPATVQHPPLLVADNSSSTATTSSSSAGSSTCLLASLFSSAAPLSTTIFNDLIASVSNPDRRGFTPSSPLEPTYLSLSATKSTNLFAGDGSEHHQQSCEPLTPSLPHMSATALLQKSAQISSTATNSSLLSGFTLSTATSLPLMNNQQNPSNNIHENYQWEYQNRKIDLIEQKRLSSGLDLGLQFDDGGEGSTVVVGGLPEFSSSCGVKPATFDFLGLEMGPVCSNSELSAIMTSIVSDGLEMGSSFGSRSTIGQDRNGMGKKPNGP